MVRWRLVAGGVVLAVSALGFACSDDDDGTTSPDDAAQPADGNGGGAPPGAWTGEFDTGTNVAVELFVDSSDPDLAAFEELREAVGAPAVLYGRVTATNESGTPDTGRFLTLTGGEGEQLADDAVVLNFACATAYTWSQTPGISPEAIALYEAVYGEDCGGATIAGPPIPPGETVVYYVALEAESEPEFERVFAGLGQELEQ